MPERPKVLSLKDRILIRFIESEDFRLDLEEEMRKQVPFNEEEIIEVSTPNTWAIDHATLLVGLLGRKQ